MGLLADGLQGVAKAAVRNVIRVRYISDTSMTNEGTIRWRPNESTEGDAAGSGASGQAPGRAELRSQAPTVSGELVRTTRSQGASDGSSLCSQPGHRLPLG